MVAGAGNKGGIIDYTNTCFHNSLIVKHDASNPISGLNRGAKNAFEQADIETREASDTSMKTKLTKEDMERISKLRGKEAMDKIRAENDLKALDAELGKMFKADGMQRIEKGKKDPVFKPHSNQAHKKVKQE